MESFRLKTACLIIRGKIIEVMEMISIVYIGLEAIVLIKELPRRSFVARSPIRT